MPIDEELQRVLKQEVHDQINHRLGDFRRDQHDLVRNELLQLRQELDRSFDQRIKVIETEAGATRSQIERMTSHVENEQRILQLKVDTLTMTTGKLVKTMEGGHDGTLSMVARIRLLEEESKELKAGSSGKLLRELLVGSAPLLTGAVMSGVFWLIYLLVKSGITP